MLLAPDVPVGPPEAAELKPPDVAPELMITEIGVGVEDDGTPDAPSLVAPLQFDPPPEAAYPVL